MSISAAIPPAEQTMPSKQHALACTHCALPVPKGLIEPGADTQFCCSGCRAAYAVIHGCGLDAYYRLRDASGGTGETLRGTEATQPGRFTSFDSETFHALHVQPMTSGLCSVDLRLEGVHCAACVWLIEKLPRVVRSACGQQAGEGLVEARLSMRQATVRITWDPTRVKLSAIAQALDTLGYRPHPAKGLSRQAARRNEERKQLMNIGLAGALAGNIMLLAIAQYAGLWGGIERQYDQFFRWLGAGLGLVALLGPGRVFFRGAWAALMARSPHLDLPIALALGVGGVAGAVNVVLGRGDIYFDSLAVLVFLLLVGRYIQFRQQRLADDAVSLMASLTPGDCRRRNADGTFETVPVEALAVGDEVEVLPGNIVPADGTVITGHASVVAALLTGESRPVHIAPGGDANAGTQILGQRITLRVTQLGEDTRVGRLMSLVEDGLESKPAIVQATDRIAGWFVIAVSLIAIVVFIAWSTADVGLAVDHTVALLIVACPCALGLATPLTLAVAIGRAARRDILIKSGSAIERAAKGGLMFLDKTGTVTTGQMRLLGWEGDASLRRWVAAAERGSTHPVALALVAGLTDADDESAAADESAAVTHHPNGVEADLPIGRLAVGSTGMMQRLSVTVPAMLAQRAAHVSAEGFTPVLIALQGRVAALAWVGDGIHTDAAAALRQTRQMGWRLRLVSGDQPGIAQRVGSAIGLDASDVLGETPPEGKLGLVQGAQHQRAQGQTIAMVGDGVNDAAALAAADLGIAACGGAEASLAAADVYLACAGLSPLVEFLALSRQTLRVVRRNLAVSLCYNALVIALAAAGMITPLLAAVLMPLSSATVLTLALGGQWRAPRKPLGDTLGNT